MFKSDAHNTLHPRCNAAAPGNCIKKKGAKLGPKNRYNFDTHPLLHVVAPCLLEVSYPCFFFVHACCVSSNIYIYTHVIHACTLRVQQKSRLAHDAAGCTHRVPSRANDCILKQCLVLPPAPCLDARTGQARV